MILLCFDVRNGQVISGQDNFIFLFFRNEILFRNTAEQYTQNRIKYSVGRESIFAVVAHTLSPVRVFHLIASGTLSAIRVFPHKLMVLCRPL